MVVIVFAIIFFIVGWFSYEIIFDFVTEEISQRIVVTSVQESFNHRLITALSFTLAGVLTVVSALLVTRFSVWCNFWGIMLTLVSTTIVSFGVWTAMLAKRAIAVDENFVKMSKLPETSLPISIIRLYEIGFIGSISVLVTAVALIIVLRYRRNDGEANNN